MVRIFTDRAPRNRIAAATTAATAAFGLAALLTGPVANAVGETATRSQPPSQMSVPAQETAPAATVTLDMVTVGDPGNQADPATGYGAVSEVFAISKTEVSIAEYVAFLNAIATVPPNDVIAGLYKEEMADPDEDPGALISRSGTGTAADPFMYAAISSEFLPDAAARPVPWVTWFDAARFANWMHNGATESADTETGAYTLANFQDDGYVARNSDARYWIPSEDEWYKAAYFDPTKPGDSKYWTFPTMSDVPPRFAAVNETAPPPAANFQNVSKDNPAGVLAPVGSYADSPSHYGTLDQGGQLWEWTEAAYPDPERGPNRIVRGGSWGPGITPLSKSVRRDYGPMSADTFYYDDDTGFRLAGTSGG